ncbi:MAG: hypothetical protein ACLQMT_00825 [Candidatus Acidiferrales bacterium]
MQGSEECSRRLSKYEKLLILLFLLSLPLINPWVRGDGVGYYAYARSLLIERRLDFEKDWQHGNESFVMGRLDSNGHVLANQYTPTGHIANIWSVGPSLLWAPFLVVTHLGVILFDKLGGNVRADGFSAPYLVTMAAATALYGFGGLWISFRLAREYFQERWAFLATLGIWWGSSLPVYMYFNPSWSHAHSAFVVALFLWYWHRTRSARTLPQWILLGIVSGLMIDVYYPNGVLLLIPLLEACTRYWHEWKLRTSSRTAMVKLFSEHVVYVAAFAAALLPTLLSRRIIFGGFFQTGYPRNWHWSSPEFWNVLFSADHGLLSWTPILILSLIGLALFSRADHLFAAYLIVAFVAFYAVISFYPDWDGMSSFGNRFFISLTPIFILGLAALFDSLARIWQERPAAIFASGVTAAFILWNLGLVFQWGMHLIPARGPISWRDAAYNQVSAVPRQAAQSVRHYLTGRKQFLDRIEQQDVNQIRSRQTEGTE